MTHVIKKGKVGMNLTEGSILRRLLMFAIPIVLTTLVQQLYSMVDLAVIGQYVGTLGTIGVNTGGEIADLVSPVAMGFPRRVKSIFPSYMERGKKENQETVGTLLVFDDFDFHYLSGDRDFLSHADFESDQLSAGSDGTGQPYMVITAVGFPFIFGYYAVCGIFARHGRVQNGR